MPDALIGTVIGIHKPGLPSFWKCFASNSITMVLRGDITATGSNFQARLIVTAVSKFEFKCFCTNGMGKYLMAHANAESRVAVDELSDCFMCVWHGDSRHAIPLPSESTHRGGNRTGC